MTITSDKLLQGVKRRVSVPANQQLLVDSDIFGLADDCLRSTVIPMILGIRQDFLVYKQDVQCVANQNEYRIPKRAIGRTLRDLKIKDALSNPTTKRDMTLIEIEDEHIFRGASDPHSFYFKGDRIVIVGAPSTSNLYLEMWYQIRHSAFCAVSDAGKVTNITGNVVTVNNVPSTFANGALIDFIEGISGCSILSFDKAIANVAGTQLTFSSGDVPTDLAIGDYVAIAETTPVLQLPDEIAPYLETLTARAVLQAIGDFEGYQAIDREEKSELESVKMMLEPRIRGENRVILNRNSLLRAGKSMGIRRNWI